MSSERLVRLLALHSYREGDFLLSSGRSSSFYLDAKQVTHRPQGAVEVGEAVLRAIAPFGVSAIGGPTMGADAIVTSTVVASARVRAPIAGFVVRKEPKGHGLEKWIEGVDPDGVRVALVDDVITSGRSVLKAVERARQAGAEVAVVVGLVDRGEGGADAIRDAGLDFVAICHLGEIREAAREAASLNGPAPASPPAPVDSPSAGATDPAAGQ